MSVPYHRMRDRYYRILGSRCNGCGAESFPPVHVCRKCGSEKLSSVEMPTTGKLLSFTLQKESVSGFEEQEPMIFGLIELSNHVRIVSQIVDVPYETIAIGQKVRAVFRRIKSDGPSGQIYYGYKFSLSRRERPPSASPS